MPVGLITNSSAGGFIRRISANTSNVDLHALFGSPSVAIEYTLIITAAATVSSSTAAGVSIDATGFDSSSVGVWEVDGDITGAGGDGGDGGGLGGFGAFAGGGGGGGGGAVVGTGGSGHESADDGDDGTATDGGAGGASVADAASNPLTGALAGEAGGDAVQINHPITVTLSGTIAGAGGGGGGSNCNLVDDTLPGGDGGDLGVAGDESGGPFSAAGGAAGFAVRYSESGDATITGGTVIGTVG